MSEHSTENAALHDAILGALIGWAGDDADLDDCREAAAYMTPRLAQLPWPRDVPTDGADALKAEQGVTDPTPALTDAALERARAAVRAFKADQQQKIADAVTAALAPIERLADEWAEDYPGPMAACYRDSSEWWRDLRAALAEGKGGERRG